MKCPILSPIYLICGPIFQQFWGPIKRENPNGMAVNEFGLTAYLPITAEESRSRCPPPSAQSGPAAVARGPPALAHSEQSELHGQDFARFSCLPLARSLLFLANSPSPPLCLFFSSLQPYFPSSVCLSISPFRNSAIISGATRPPALSLLLVRLVSLPSLLSPRSGCVGFYLRQR